MSETNRSLGDVETMANGNDSTNVDDNSNDDTSAHEALIRDLTSENVVILNDVLGSNGRALDTAAHSAANVPVGDSTAPQHGPSDTILDTSKEDAAYSSRAPNVDRNDHDYSGIQRASEAEKSTRIIERSDRIIAKNNASSLLRTIKRKLPPGTPERSIARVKNITELKKMTPRLKFVSTELATTTTRTPASAQPAKAKTPSNREIKVSSNQQSREQLKNYCRTCAGLKLPLVDIFSGKGMQMRLNQQMRHLVDIKSHDSLSTQMCMDCICDLKMSYKFFMQIKKAQVKLQSIRASLYASNATTNVRAVLEDDNVRANAPTVTTKSTEFPKQAVKKVEVEKREAEANAPSPSEIHEETAERTIRRESATTIETREEDSCVVNCLSDDNESIEEFDPEDPSFHADVLEYEVECSAENTKSARPVESTRESGKTEEPLPTKDKLPAGTVVETRPERKPDASKDPNRTVYQYDTKLQAYIKVEPPDDDRGSKSADNGTANTRKIENGTEPVCKDGLKQPNILKRKISVGKDFLENPVACAKQSDSTHVRSGKRDMKKPKLDVKNALNVTSENEDGIMYVTVKGSKPNELLLVKVKKMEKSGDKSGKQETKKEEKKRAPSSEGLAVEKILKKLEPSAGKKEADFQMERSKILDIREQKIAEQIEEYKRRREKILGGSSSVPNTLKFKDGAIRFVNPVETPANPTDDVVRVKIEPCDDTEEGGERVEATPNCQPSDENEEKSDVREDEDTEAYDNAGEYLARLARLKKKWEEAKRKKENLRRELSASYNEGNMEKLSRILGDREKNLSPFQDYLKQRKIFINHLKDEDVVSLYENLNASTRNNFPDLIDEATPLDYIEQENYLECDYCPETFALREVLEEHLKTHDYKLMYWCEDCHLEFPTVKSKRAHNSECMKKLTCRYCELVLDSKGKKRQHEQKHVDSMYGQMCDVCGEKFKHQATLDQHFKTQHMTWEKIYQCPKCPKKFAFKQKLTFHTKSVHTTLRAWLCEDCGADFKNPASLRHHRIRKHHPTGNKRECPVCRKLVPFYSLSKHMYTHKAYTIQCPHCDKMFKNSSTLKQHVRIHEDQRQYRCDTCGVGFNRRDGLKLHMRVHQKSDSRALKECSCQICSEKFPNHSMLVIHRNRVHKDGRQYTCHICNRSMLSTRSLEWHMSNIHNETMPGGGSVKEEADSQPEKKRVSCVHCDKTFKTEMILRTHIKNTHIEKSPTKCLDCEQTFTSDVRLRHHMMIAHNRLEGTLTCPHCPKRFVNQLRLKTHMISHSEDRPYTCEICGFNLKTKIQLIKHHQNRHSDERPLQCRYCPWRCKQVSALVCHERTHTNERPYSCMVCRQRFKYLGDKNKHERRHESLGGTGFKRIVAGRNLKQSKIQAEETSTSEQEQIDYEQRDEEEHLVEEQQSEEYTEGDIVKFEAEDVGEEYEQEYKQEYEETSREASEAAEVIMSMEDTTVYTEEVTADNIESAEMITDEIMTNNILQPDITVVHLQQQDDNGKIQVIPVMLSLPDLSDTSTEVNLATASIMYNN